MTVKRWAIWRAMERTTIGDGCWEFCGSRLPFGHGRIRHEGKDWLVHRLIYQELVGDIPEEMCVCHKCDNPPCIRPSHLFLGTMRDNMHDMIRKNRQRHDSNPKGEKHHNSKLTKEKALLILSRCNEPDFSPTKMGIELAVDACTVIDVVKRRTWRHVQCCG